MLLALLLEAGELSTAVIAQDDGPADGKSSLAVVAALEDSITKAIDRAEKSVVAIAIVNSANEAMQADARMDRQWRDGWPRNFGPNREGPKESDPGYVPADYASGVIVDASGLILTNHHVLHLGTDDEFRPEIRYWVRLHDRTPYQARIKAADPRVDLAVLELLDEQGDPAANLKLPVMPLGNGDKIKKGQFVVALGNPYAVARDGEASASWGIISNIARKARPNEFELDIRQRKNTLHHFGTLIQTDARLNLGTSGGALINLRGEMIGLTTSMEAIAGHEQSAGYAIPVNDLFRRAVDQLKEGKEIEFGFLGIGPMDMELGELQRGRRGVRVYSVSKGTPAATANIKESDVITHINGAQVEDADDLMLRIGSLAPLEQVQMVVERGGRVENVLTEVSKYRVVGPIIATSKDPPWRGVEVDFPTVVLNPWIMGIMEWPAQECVAAKTVALESPAWKAGLRPGMLITGVDAVVVSNPVDFRTIIATKKGPVSLHVWDEEGFNKIVEIPVE